MKQLFKVLSDIKDLTSYIHVSVGEGEEWAAITSSVAENREHYRKVLRGKRLFSELYGNIQDAEHS
jgi:hypothetical protein